MGSFVWFSCLLPVLWSLNSQKLCPFCIFFADVSNKSKAVTAVYVYAFKSYRFTLSENDIGYYADSALFLIFYSSISRELLLRPI